MVKIWGWTISAVAIMAISYVALFYGFGLIDLYFGTLSYGGWRNALIGGALLVIPYLLGGIFWGMRHPFYCNSILLSGLLAAMGERMLILLLAYWILGQFRQVRPDGTVFYVEGNANLITAIQSEALGYFGWAYILWGIPLSIAILYITAYLVQRQNSVYCMWRGWSGSPIARH